MPTLVRIPSLKNSGLHRGSQPPAAPECMKRSVFFCEKGNKYIKKSHSREPLIQASELRADEKVRAMATIKMDNKILAVTSQELSRG